MVSLENSTKYFKKNSTNSPRALPENRRGGNISQLIFFFLRPLSPGHQNQIRRVLKKKTTQTFIFQVKKKKVHLLPAQAVWHSFNGTQSAFRETSDDSGTGLLRSVGQELLFQFYRWANLYLVPKYFHHPQRKPHTHEEAALHPSSPPVPGNNQSVFCLYGLTYSG